MRRCLLAEVGHAYHAALGRSGFFTLGLAPKEAKVAHEQAHKVAFTTTPCFIKNDPVLN